MTRFLRENIMADRTMIQLVCIILVVANTNCDLIQFKPGVVYSYDYKSSTTLHGVGHIDTTAEILIELVNAEEIGQHCLMTVEDVSYKLSNEGTEGALGTYSKGDFSHWFSFLMTKHGEILSVFYGEEDKPEVIVLKKLLIGALSVKLHSTETTLAKGVPWSYRVNETGHEGYHEATYSVRSEGAGFLFEKKRYGHVVENANASHVKSILYDHSLEIPRAIDVQEYFIPPNNRGKRKQSDAKVTQHEDSLLEETDIPLMKGSSWSTLKYTGQEISDRLNTIQMPDNVIKGDLRIDEIPVPKIPLSENERFIAGNITCMKKNPSPKSPERTGCFQNIIQMIGRLSKEDMEHFAVAYIKPNKTNLNNSEVQDREIAIDALGAVATEITQELLTNMILLSNRPNATLIMQALIHFVELDRSPADVAVEAITRLAFYPELTFTDRKLMDLVHNRAILILGSVAKTLKASEFTENRQKADEIVKAVEDSLGVHDHWHHRQVRSTLSQQDYNDYIEEKAALIHSLGNAISPSSYEHLLSYVNNSDSHPMLRRSGVHAIGKYSHQQAARTLLDSAMLDVDETVRYVAATEYLRHSHAKDMHHIIDEYGNINVTLYSEERHLSRQRRGLFDGFQVELKTPSFEWTKEIGTSDIGGSMGLILKNSFNLDIKPLEGSMKIDIFDHAYAKGHVGYIDFEFTMLEAKVCFKGESSYSLNILQEFDFDKIKTMVTQFDKVVANVIGAIRDAISKFVELLSPDSISFSKIFDNFINAVKDLPNFVKSLTSIVHDIMRRIGKYIGLPDFFYHLQNVIFRISGLFNAVRRDVMELYNSINDAITVTLPWAAEQVLEAIDYASSAVEILFESPVSAIKDISRFIFQIKNAVSGILHAKRRIEVACFFDEGSPPYWFNLKDELTDIWEEIKSLKNSFKNMGNWSVDGDKIKEFTGIPQSAVKAYIVADILGLFDLLSGPIERLKEIAEPFLRTYQTVAKAIENIKDGYERVKSGYETAKTFLNKIFGSRGAKKFPRKIAITNCGKGFYPSRQGNLPRGIDLEIKTGSTLVSPFTGNVTRSGKYQITIDVQDELKDTEVIINHVNLDNKNQNRMVYKGTRLGRVVAASSDCTPNAIHLSMRRKGTTYYFDPTKYIEKRKILTPPWKQYCDEYLLIFKVNTETSRATIPISCLIPRQNMY
ncbi:uncharacterized protein [Ptychodera flava]|uniref:uncharacterized protein n=1 Tax=Ptychodera flava TaxID=63121 RepID=UPI00396A232C